MDLKEMTIEALEERKAAIAVEVDADGAALDALEAEARSIKDEIERRKAEEEKRNEIRNAVAAGAGTVEKTFEREEKKSMTMTELRSLPAYVEEYANYIKSGDDKECRSVISENAPEGTTGSGPVPVPVIVDQFIRTAWERDPIMSRVRRTFVRGNLRVAFELSADPAIVHNEAAAQAPTEETLELGVVELIPANIKKWITITDEAKAMGGEEFLRYIYDEITYQIVKKAAALGVADIAGASASSSAFAIGVPKVNMDPSVTTIPTAVANLSDEATDICVIMNRLTEVEFINAYADGKFAVDPFAGLTKLYTSALPAFSAASADDVYAIVGDLRGLQFNFPEGDGVVLKYDDLSLAEKDLIKIVGRQYAAHGVTAPGRFVNITKENP